MEDSFLALRIRLSPNMSIEKLGLYYESDCYKYKKKSLRIFNLL